MFQDPGTMPQDPGTLLQDAGTFFVYSVGPSGKNKIDVRSLEPDRKFNLLSFCFLFGNNFHSTILLFPPVVSRTFNFVLSTSLVYWGTSLVCRGTSLVRRGTSLVCRGTSLVCRGTILVCRGTSLVSGPGPGPNGAPWDPMGSRGGPWGPVGPMGPWRPHGIP